MTIFEYDVYRYYGAKETLRQRLLRPLELQWTCAFRKRQKAKNQLIKAWFTLRLMHLSRRTQIQIPANTEVGPGLYIGHFGRIIVNPQAKIGKNVNLATGVTIGIENRGKRKGCPVIGDCVWIGTNAIVVGNVRIGSDVLIAPLTYVNFDVPDHSIVIGNPGRIIPRENATEGYVEKKI